MQTYSTPAQIIDALGGNRKFALWWGAADTDVANWRRPGRTFPTNLYLVMSERLRRENRINAPPSCWGMVEPAAVRRAS